MSFPPYAEESLLHRNAVSSCKAMLENSNAAALSYSITQLEPSRQVVLALMYFEGFRTKDIAKILKLSVGEVIRLHATTVLALRESLANESKPSSGAEDRLELSMCDLRKKTSTNTRTSRQPAQGTATRCGIA